jgi:hypothetical protein
MNDAADSAMPRYPTNRAALLEAACAALCDAATAKVANYNGMAAVEHATLTYGGEEWAVCRAAQVSTAARLVDVAVSLRGDRKGVVAILTSPRPLTKRAKFPDLPFLRRYQSAAWHGLGVVFVADAKDHPLSMTWDPSPAPARGDFDERANAVEARLKEENSRWEFTCSRALEKLVRPAVGDVLCQGASSVQKVDERRHFQSFWRHPSADGVWLRKGASPERIVLEVKMHEDVPSPLCQVIDYLGFADAVINVRGAKGKTINYKSKDVMRLLSERLPVRYIELP